MNTMTVNVRTKALLLGCAIEAPFFLALSVPTNAYGNGVLGFVVPSITAIWHLPSIFAAELIDVTVMSMFFGWGASTDLYWSIWNVVFPLSTFVIQVALISTLASFVLSRSISTNVTSLPQ